MNIGVFSTKSYDREFLRKANETYSYSLDFYEAKLSCKTVRLAEEYDAVCCFVNDELKGNVVHKLSEGNTRLIAMRCAGYNNVDLKACREAGMTVTRVPAYSPNSVSEHTIGLILALGRKLYKAYNRTRDGNFSIEGLLGFDLDLKTVGVVGTGKIGTRVAQTLAGFGCKILAYDLYPNDEVKKIGKYVELEELFAESDIITLHCPLTPETHHMIDSDALDQMRDGMMLINTSRGALVDTEAVIPRLKSGKVGYLGIDVYEEEGDLFFEDFSTRVIQDDTIARLLSFPNVMVTSHQAFFTHEAMTQIAEKTFENIDAFVQGTEPPGLLKLEEATA